MLLNLIVDSQSFTAFLILKPFARFREAQPEEIIAAVPGIETSTSVAEGTHIYFEETFFPIIDGEDITDLPMNLMTSGQWQKEKDMIIGVNTEESLDFQFYFPEGINVDENELKVGCDNFS